MCDFLTSKSGRAYLFSNLKKSIADMKNFRCYAILQQNMALCTECC